MIAAEARTIPLTLVPSLPRDRRGRALHDLRISVIDACNFRCPYCMPEDRVPNHASTAKVERLSFDEIERLARAFVALGVRKLRLTGGEPLLRRDLASLVERLAAIPDVEDLALTTNGSLLAAHAEELHAAGLRRLTISLDSVDPQRFAAMSGGRGEIADVLAGIEAAERAGFRSIKLNCVVRRGVNEADVLPLVERFRATRHVVRFIEYMDVGSCNGWKMDEVVPSRELRDRIALRWPLRELDPNYRGEVAERYGFADGAGEIGFVSSVSAPFCGDCHRARLSADGRLYTCLFAAGGFDLRTPLRGGVDDAALQALIAERWQRRDDRYSEVRGAVRRGDAPVEMFRIGG